MIWRNDDISYKTELGQFECVHKLFKKYTVLHTIALICRDIEKNPELINFINANNIDVQIHCWEHKDFTQLLLVEVEDQFRKSIQTIQKYFKHRPTVFFPPWNKSNDAVECVAKEHGLTVSNQKVSLSQYIRTEGDVKESVINFHSWSLDEIKILEEALVIYNSKR